MMKRQQALGMIETWGLVPAIEAADAGVKAANVQLVGYEIVQGALLMVAFLGEVAAVQASVSAGCAAAEKVGRVIGSHVIPRPEAELRMLFKGKSASQLKNPPPPPEPVQPNPQGRSANEPIEVQPDVHPAVVNDPGVAEPAQGKKHTTESIDTLADLAGMTTEALRHLARSVEGLALHGREISRANKDQLIRAIMEAGA